MIALLLSQWGISQMVCTLEISRLGDAVVGGDSKEFRLVQRLVHAIRHKEKDLLSGMTLMTMMLRRVSSCRVIEDEGILIRIDVTVTQKL